MIDRLNFGGAEKLTIQLINYLDPEIFEKTLIYLFEPQKDLSFKDKINKDVNIIFFDILKFRLPEKVSRLNKLLRNSDIVHSCLESSNLYCSIVNFVYPSDRKFISTVHGIDFPFANDPELKKLYATSGIKSKFLFKDLQTYLFKYYSGFISVCNDIKHYLIEKRKIDSKKITVIYHGIDIASDNLPLEELNELRKNYSIHNNDYIIGYVGRLAYGKGLEYLLKEFRKFEEKIPNAKLLIIGDGELREFLTKYVKDNSLVDKVIFTGYQKNVINYYSLIDVYVIPSFSESTNLTLLEAMNAGVTAVSSDAGGLKEIIEDGINGYLFNVGDFNEMGKKIMHAYNCRNKSESIRSNAKKTVLNKFNISNNLPEIQKHILSYIDPHRLF